MRYPWDCSKYKIYSRSGEFYGQFIACSETDALIQLHKQAGYKCEIDHEVDSDRIIFDDEETERMCGQADDWDIRSV